MYSLCALIAFLVSHGWGFQCALADGQFLSLAEKQQLMRDLQCLLIFLPLVNLLVFFCVVLALKCETVQNLVNV